MDDKSQRERLEQELRFLKESFEAEVISKEEYERGKERVEKKLKGTENEPKQKEEPKEQQKEQISERNRLETKSETTESKEEYAELKISQDETSKEEQIEQAQKIEETAPASQKKDKLFKYTVVFVVLALVIFFSYSLFKPPKTQEKVPQVTFAAICNSSDDCKLEGKEGICIEPGAINAKCEFKEIPKTNIIILNDRKNCFNCDTQRVLGILESWFGAVNAKEIDYNTNEGEKIAEKFNLNLLPTYILDENITKKSNYENVKSLFVKKDSNYILREDAAGSTFYFNRDNIQNKLDLFIKENESASVKAEKNLKEFIDNFKEVKFEKHLSGSAFVKELGIKTFPTFLVNNQIKFSGVLTAETIKNNFCKLNKLPECGKSLSKSLV